MNRVSSVPATYRTPARPASGLALAWGVVVAGATTFLPLDAHVAPNFPAVPTADQTVLDWTEFFPAEARAKATVAATSIVSAHGSRVHVVVIPSLADSGAEGWTLAEYARDLFEGWTVRGSTAPPLPELGAEEKEMTHSSVGGGGEPISAEKSVVVVLSVAEKQVVVRAGSTFRARADDIRTVEQIFAHFLDEGDPASALTEGVSGIGKLAADKKVSLPGNFSLAYLLIVAFVLIGFSVVDYLRKGPTCVSYRCWRGLFSGVTASMTWALSRSVDLGSRLTDGSGMNEEPDASVCLGEW